MLETILSTTGRISRWIVNSRRIKQQKMKNQELRQPLKRLKFLIQLRAWIELLRKCKPVLATDAFSRMTRAAGKSR
jgi:UDP-N-acetylglucosamine:LPS N-acetylglucosamine transferase